MIEEFLEDINDKLYGIIYVITNKINGKVYVGKTKHTAEKRWKGHLYGLLRQQRKGDVHLYISRAIQKYGPENFTIQKIDEAFSLEELNEKERYWIAKLDARNKEKGYNMTKGGDCGPGGPMFAGHTHSAETKAQMSVDRTGEKNANYGNRWHHTPEMKYSDLHGKNNPMYGKTQSEKSRKKNSDSQTGVIYYSNPSEEPPNDVLRFRPTDLIDVADLERRGYKPGNWHCTKEYKNNHKNK